ncbi:MAG: flagellar basal body-associated protein FliL [Sulfuricurvum sp.]|nr:flagellar basal body-associated protein FliL [Sulfuricurvum sp.]MDD5387268.1 flagellar basal body-associated protein FliL [Sulfuricurvum sp.]
MAEKEKEHHEEGAPEGGEKKKSGNMLLIIIIAVLFLIIIIGGIIAFMMMGSHEEESGAATHKEASAKGEGKAAESEAPAAESEGHGSSATEVGIMFPLDLFTVNLLSESGRRYLKVEMNLELEGEELALELETKKPVLRDIIIRILSSKSLEEISTVKGKETLKEQIVSELNTRVKDGKIKNVYFVDFVVQ